MTPYRVASPPAVRRLPWWRRLLCRWHPFWDPRVRRVYDAYFSIGCECLTCGKCWVESDWP